MTDVKRGRVPTTIVYLSVFRLRPAHGQYVSISCSFKFATNIYLDSRMDWLDFVAQGQGHSDLTKYWYWPCKCQVLCGRSGKSGMSKILTVELLTRSPMCDVTDALSIYICGQWSRLGRHHSATEGMLSQWLARIVFVRHFGDGDVRTERSSVCRQQLGGCCCFL